MRILRMFIYCLVKPFLLNKQTNKGCFFLNWICKFEMKEMRCDMRDAREKNKRKKREKRKKKKERCDFEQEKNGNFLFISFQGFMIDDK